MIGCITSNCDGVSVADILWKKSGLAIELDQRAGGFDTAHLGEGGARGKDGAGGDLGDKGGLRSQNDSLIFES